MSEKSDWEQGYDQAQRRFYEERKILTARIAELDAEVTKCHELQDSYCDRITELEVENAGLKQLPQPIKFWSDEKKQIYKVNERRTAKSGSEECGE